MTPKHNPHHPWPDWMPRHKPYTVITDLLAILEEGPLRTNQLFERLERLGGSKGLDGKTRTKRRHRLDSILSMENNSENPRLHADKSIYPALWYAGPPVEHEPRTPQAELTLEPDDAPTSYAEFIVRITDGHKATIEPYVDKFDISRYRYRTITLDGVEYLLVPKVSKT